MSAPTPRLVPDQLTPEMFRAAEAAGVSFATQQKCWAAWFAAAPPAEAPAERGDSVSCTFDHPKDWPCSVCAAPAAPAEGGLPKMAAAFRTTVSNGQDAHYAMVFRFDSLAALHAADDEWRAFRSTPRVTGGREECNHRRVLQHMGDGTEVWYCPECGNNQVGSQRHDD